MKTRIGGIIRMVLYLWLGLFLGYRLGYREAKNELPSCLYLDRPRANDVKPEGCDGKEGVDWYHTPIAGGGIYVDLSKWK